MRLSDDAWTFLQEGMGVPGERVPDGPRHRAAIVELRERGFLGWGERHLEVTPAGNAHYLGRKAEEARARRAAA